MNHSFSKPYLHLQTATNTPLNDSKGNLLSPSSPANHHTLTKSYLDAICLARSEFGDMPRSYRLSVCTSNTSICYKQRQGLFMTTFLWSDSICASLPAKGLPSMYRKLQNCSRECLCMCVMIRIINFSFCTSNIVTLLATFWVI